MPHLSERSRRRLRWQRSQSLVPEPASAATPTNTTALQNAVKVGNDTSGIRQHLKALQEIADANGGTRSTGTPGHEELAGVRQAASSTRRATSTSPRSRSRRRLGRDRPPTLSATPAPPRRGWQTPTSRRWRSRARAPSPTRRSASIDFAAPTATASTSTSGCEAADFPADLAGKVAVIQRGTCDFGVKAKNAQARRRRRR